MTSDKWAPRVTGIRDPRDAKKRNGMFWNWTRYLFIGGTAGNTDIQGGSKMPTMAPKSGQDSTGPISDRGKGR